eukprot:3333065-Amphidinium_carterae.1
MAALISNNMQINMRALVPAVPLRQEVRPMNSESPSYYSMVCFSQTGVLAQRAAGNTGTFAPSSPNQRICNRTAKQA